MSRSLLLGALALLVSACATKVPLPSVSTNDLQGDGDPKAAWAQVLAQHVNVQGQVDYAALAAQPQDLETWVAYIAQVSPENQPERFASKDEQLAYYLDAYNGLAMYGVLRSGVVPAQKVRFFLLRKYTIGGKETSLYTWENKVIRPLGEPRIHFALNCMAASCPRLPQAPWEEERLEQQLEAAAVEFFNDERHLRVDAEQGVVYLSEILDFFPEDFLAVAPSLIDYVNRYRHPPIPSDYRIEFIPYDWTVNAQTES